jgi:hypothetical protein
MQAFQDHLNLKEFYDRNSNKVVNVGGISATQAVGIHKAFNVKKTEDSYFLFDTPGL